MKIFNQKKLWRYWFIVSLLLLNFLPQAARGVAPDFDETNGPSYFPLNSWSFYDRTNWTSDFDYPPVSFTNLDYSYLGNGSSLVVDSTNAAWLHYNVFESDGNTNLTVNRGTVMFWFAPSWNGTNEGGTGSGEWARLFEVGSYTPDSSYGLWSIYVDPEGANIYFSTQTNDLSSNFCTFVSAPIAWTSNYFHFVALTYSATNTALYLDGALATNGPPMTNYPGLAVLTNGFYIGSDSNGLSQAHGLFNWVKTYDVALDGNTIQQMFTTYFAYYMMSPWNTAMAQVFSANSSPSPTYYQAITGIGSLQPVGTASSCVTSSNVWLTNIVATVAGNGTMNVTFTIAGGSNDVPYDVFANSILGFPASTSMPWAWMGQGYHCNIYSLPNLPNTACFLILGGPKDSDFDGLTDAYETLSSHTDPLVADTDGDGLSDAWEVLLGLNPNNAGDNAQMGVRANYSYNSVDWLGGISGIKSGTITLDNEGNVTGVSQ